MDLNDTAVREQLLNKHPIVRADYTVITPMISNAYSMVRELIWQRRTGLFMYAHPRMGKTLCACAVRQLISAEFPDKYAVYHIADDNRHVNFLRELVVSIGQVKGGHEAYSLLLEKFILHVKSQLSALDGNHFVLIVDEIQQVTLEHYNILLVIHNRLKSLGVSMTTVGFGQPTILDRRELMLSVSATNLVARFLSHAIKFDGCLNANTLMSILHQYDHEKEYPPDSGWSFTRFFCRKLMRTASGYQFIMSSYGSNWSCSSAPIF
ncbi:hypothetical protein C4K18_3057 [Pseudomonas chlororaphis subsp. aurantiaca]|nr:hypothetical protein C4K18_3057 [Pseudomonas chlororaphis subsp. aurantiaca]